MDKIKSILGPLWPFANARLKRQNMLKIIDNSDVMSILTEGTARKLRDYVTNTSDFDDKMAIKNVKMALSRDQNLARTKMLAKEAYGLVSPARHRTMIVLAIILTAIIVFLVLLTISSITNAADDQTLADYIIQ